ncbi:MAG: EAL domain-containing protein, partial [Ornithinimicrobium sp.]
AEEVVGKHSPEMFHDPEELAQAAADLGVPTGFAVFAALAHQHAPSRLWTYVRADGSTRKVQLAVTELRDDHGNLYGYLRVAIDATSSVRAERNLAESEARWGALLEHLPGMTVLVLDEDLRIQAAAGQGARTQGLIGAEGLLLEAHSSPKNMAMLQPLLLRALNGQECRVEVNATKNGAAHEVVVSPLPLTPEGTKQVLIVGRDVSADRERARELEASTERAERLFTDAPHGVALLGSDSTVLRLNQSMAAWVGNATGVRLRDLAGPGQKDALDVHLEEAISRRPALVRTDWELVMPDGQELHLGLSSRAVQDIHDDADDVVLVNAVDVSERRGYERRLAHLAEHDALTGLANRRKFDQELQRHGEWCQRYGNTGALLLLDLDHFKDVNDSLGHHSGDQLIVSTGAVIRSGVRSTDLVARVGGDEFAVLLPQGDRQAAEAVGRNLVEKVRQHTATFDGTRRRVTASIGGVTFADAVDNGTDILGLADMMMYDAKEAGRDRCLVLDRDKFAQPRMSARLQWRERIERALENDAFVLHLQPIYDLATDRVHAAEALLRMNDDGLVGPNRFLYVAEQTGLAPAIDAWVVRRSVGLLAELRRHDPHFSLEVNLSAHSIGDPTVERTIVESLKAHDVEPSALILEITETAAVADIQAARAFAERMTALGCQFALDDFGAGFGSFYYLKHLLFDFVKIDGEFIANCSSSRVDRTILRSIVGIARGLGKRTVAEFVTDADVLQVVREEGVDFAQGFEIGKPVSTREFVEAWMSIAAEVTEAPT